MSALTRKQTHTLNEIVLSYFRGEPIPVVKVRLQEISSELSVSCSELYKSIKIREDNDELSHIVQILFKKYRISHDDPIAERILHRAKNLHDLLTILCFDGKKELEYLLYLINHTKPPRNWGLITLLASVTTAILGAFFHFNQTYLKAIIEWISKPFPFLVKWLSKTFSLLKNTALLGLIFSSSSLIWSWYNTLSNSTQNTTSKSIDLVFKTLSTGMYIAAYSLIYAAGGIMLWPAAALFVLGSSMQVLQSLISFYHNNQALNHLKKPNQSQDWYDHETYERKLNFRQRSMQSVWVKLSAAVATTVAVGIWDFTPPSLIITLSCVGFMMLISLTKQTFLAAIDRSYAYACQNDIRNIAIPLPSELQPQEQMTQDAIRQQQAELNQEREALAKQKEKLNEQMETIEQKEHNLEVKEKTLKAWESGVKQGLLAHYRGQSLPSEKARGGFISANRFGLFNPTPIEEPNPEPHYRTERNERKPN